VPSSISARVIRRAEVGPPRTGAAEETVRIHLRVADRAVDDLFGTSTGRWKSCTGDRKRRGVRSAFGAVLRGRRVDRTRLQGKSVHGRAWRTHGRTAHRKEARKRLRVRGRRVVMQESEGPAGDVRGRDIPVGYGFGFERSRARETSTSPSEWATIRRSARRKSRDLNRTFDRRRREGGMEGRCGPALRSVGFRRVISGGSASRGRRHGPASARSASEHGAGGWPTGPARRAVVLTRRRSSLAPAKGRSPSIPYPRNPFRDASGARLRKEDFT